MLLRFFCITYLRPPFSRQFSRQFSFQGKMSSGRGSGVTRGSGIRRGTVGVNRPPPDVSTGAKGGYSNVRGQTFQRNIVSEHPKSLSEESPVDKRPRLEELDVVTPFVVQPKIKNMPISSEASALKDPAVALSLAASVSLPADKATFRAEPDLVAIALAAQSAFLTVGRIAEIGRRQHDAIERIGRLKSEVEGERSRAEFEAARATMESAKAEAEAERARSANQLRSAIEGRANASEESLKLAKEALAKLEAELEELKKAKEKADSEASKAFEAGKSTALENYIEEVPKFENRGFKHGWLKALATAGVTLAMPIPYEQVDVEPLESDPDD